MAGYIDQVLFFCMFTCHGQDGVQVHQLKKKNENNKPISIHLDQTFITLAWSKKNLFYSFRENFSCGTWRVLLSGQDSFIIAHSVSQSRSRV